MSSTETTAPVDASPLKTSASPAPDLSGERIVVVGGGMTGHRLAARLRAQDPDGTWHLTVIGEEPQQPYDRVHLSNWFTRHDGSMLAMDPTVWDDPRITLVTGDEATSIERDAQTVTTASGTVHPYDRLVLATGSWAWAPRAEGKDLPGSFSYRTVEDVERLAEWVSVRSGALGRPLRGVVVGGGVLGLEAAAALKGMDVDTTVVEFADRLMSVQLDQGGGEMLRLLMQDQGIHVRTGVGASRFSPAGDGAMGMAHLSDDTELPVDVVVFSTGIRPRDRLAREAGLAIGERGGVVVGDSCRTSDPAIWAIGECASFEGVCAGLIAPGNDMADVVVDRFLGGERTHVRADAGTKLKGVPDTEAAAFGDVNAISPDALEVSFVDPVHRMYRKLVMSDDAKTLLGGVFVGDIALYSTLRPLLGRELGADPSAVIAPDGGGDAMAGAELPDDATVCSCNNIDAGTIRHAVTEQGCHTVGAIKECTSAGTVCGSCVPTITKMLGQELAKAGIEVSHALCEHFGQSRAELFKLVEEGGQETFTEVIAAHGNGGRGCAVCRPTVASILSTLGAITGRRHNPVGRQLGSLQDTNDFVMANIQKDGTYSVIPAMPAGEVTPDKLMVIAQVAKDYGLYVKLNGAQRIGMFGARLEQLPEIWERLVDAGFQSGHAYGKSLRMVKACLGTNWCRFGVQDSTTLAVALEKRYRGLRSPHKIKISVSGCARECAEAQGKDVGVIATNKGWNLYVGGNGGMTPAHGKLLVEDVDETTLVRCIDRFLMLYIREADKLQRTARWVEEYPGGIDELRRVIVDDTLGIGEQLEESMQHHVDSYVDEWAEAVRDPERRAKFVSFVNAPGSADPELRYVIERGQARPAAPGETDTFPSPLAAYEHAASHPGTADADLETLGDAR